VLLEAKAAALHPKRYQSSLPKLSEEGRRGGEKKRRQSDWPANQIDRKVIDREVTDRQVEDRQTGRNRPMSVGTQAGILWVGISWGVHLMGVHLMGIHFMGHPPPRRASHRHVSLGRTSHGIHFVGHTSHRRAFHGPVSYGCVPYRRHLIGVYLTGVHLMDVHLTGVYLTGVHLKGVYLKNVHLTGVHLTGVHLVKTSRSPLVDLSGSELQNTSFCARCGVAPIASVNALCLSLCFANFLLAGVFGFYRGLLSFKPATLTSS
jgi:hypothetical protein